MPRTDPWPTSPLPPLYNIHIPHTNPSDTPSPIYILYIPTFPLFTFDIYAKIHLQTCYLLSSSSWHCHHEHDPIISAIRLVAVVIRVMFCIDQCVTGTRYHHHTFCPHQRQHHQYSLSSSSSITNHYWWHCHIEIAPFVINIAHNVGWTWYPSHKIFRGGGILTSH